MVARSDCRYSLGMQALARAQLVPELEKSRRSKSASVVPAVSRQTPPLDVWQISAIRVATCQPALYSQCWQK